LFFKTIYTPFNIEQLLPHMRLKGYSPHELIYKEGDKITDYYLLLEGAVVFRRGGAGEGSPGQNSEYGPCVIGEYYYSRNTVREKSAYCGDGLMKVLEISKRVMDENNWQQVREYKEI
jgi:CRP-like cAMP-binding protein